MSRTLLKTGAALLLSVACAIAAAQTPLRLKFSHSGAETDSQHIAALEFAKRVKERSHGAIEVQVYPNSVLGNDSTALAGVRGGTIDMSMSGNPYFTGLVPKLNALDLPYEFASAQQAYRRGEVGDRHDAARSGARCSTSWAPSSSRAWRSGKWGFAAWPTTSGRSCVPRTSRA